MKNRTLTIFALAALFVLNGCGNSSSSNSPNNSSTTSNTSISTQNPDSTTQQVHDLLAQYGWHESGVVSSVWTTQLPKSYKLQPGTVPIGLYWSYHNVISKSVGLDITPYLGQTVKIWAIPVKENWRIGPSPESTYAVVTTDNGNVIGAWISKGQEGHIVDICESLNHKEFGNITGQTWGNWIAQQKLIDYSGPFYWKMHEWTPQLLLQAYFSAIDKHQYSSAYAMMSSFGQYQIMIMNVPVGHLYNTQWDPIQSAGLSDWETAQFLGMKSYHTIPSGLTLQTAEFKLYDYQNEVSKNYTVAFDATFRKPGPLNSGRNMYFTTVVRESPKAPWTIGGFGTGP